jgi:CubicO group peptidase (beta-lactamase class C family)
MHTIPITRSRFRATATLVVLALAVTVAACSSDDSGSAGADATAAVSPTTDPPAAAPPATEPPPETATPTTVGDDAELRAALQAIADQALEPGSIEWTAPASGVSVGVRLPDGREVLVASGETVDGAPFDPTAPFSASTLGWEAALTVATALVAEGTLDPAATIDAWLPNQPNAERISVQMLLDGTHGWGSFDDAPVSVYPENVVADLERTWTLAEVLATYEAIPPRNEPGTFDADGRTTSYDAMAYIAEELTGRPFADLVTEYFAEPAGLDDTFLNTGGELPEGYQHGVFDLDGPNDTSQFPLTALVTYQPTRVAMVSTFPDLLDLLDTWAEGTWTTGGRPPSPDMFPADRQAGSDAIFGLGVPYQGYCPCVATPDGNQVERIGRRPYAVGTDVQAVRYLDDGISVVVHFNSDAHVDRAPVLAVADAAHAAALTALGS